MGPLLCPVFYLKSVLNSKIFLLSSPPNISYRATTHNKANIFPLDLQGGDSIEVSVSELGTGCPFSFLNPGSVKSLISWAFALDFPQNWKKKHNWSDSGEMGKIYFPSPASSLCSPYQQHTPTHHLRLFLIFFFLFGLCCSFLVSGPSYDSWLT